MNIIGRIAAKIAEIRYQNQCNIGIIKGDYPDPRPTILPHLIETLTGHVEDRLKELERLIAEALPTDGPALIAPAGRTDREIVEQTNALALLAMRHMFQREPVEDSYKVYEYLDGYPRQEAAWSCACKIQEMLTATDPNDALAILIDEGEVIEAPPPGVTSALAKPDPEEARRARLIKRRDKLNAELRRAGLPEVGN